MDALSGDPQSILALYRRLLWLRRRSPALHGGAYQPLDSALDCFAYLRTVGDERRLVALNFAGEARRLSLLEGQYGRVLLSTHLDRNEQVSLADLVLRPHEGVIVAL